MKTLPQFDSREAEADWFASHDTTDYFAPVNDEEIWLLHRSAGWIRVDSCSSTMARSPERNKGCEIGAF